MWAGKTSDPPTTPKMPTYERKLGDNELSYFLPSRADGVNDLYIRISFYASAGLITPRRLALAWAILRVRHALLVAKVVMEPFEYASARFSYTPPNSPADALREAVAAMDILPSLNTPEELISLFVNGPRILSPDRPSTLMVAPTDRDEYHVIFCLAHCSGDGTALWHNTRDYFHLVAGSKPGSNESKVWEESELYEILVNEWTEKWGWCAGLHGKVDGPVNPIPPAWDWSMPQSNSKLMSAVSRVDFHNSERRHIGGHVFPRSQDPRPRKCTARSVVFDSGTTKRIVSKCKAEGVTPSSATYALCNVAWARTLRALRLPPASHLPMMFYGAINLRSFVAPAPESSYGYLALGYFNVVLPALPLSSEEGFWLRSRHAQQQVKRYVKSPMLLSRTQEACKERAGRARAWAKEDDELEACTKNGTAPVKPSWQPASAAPLSSSTPPQHPLLPFALPKAPSAALVGLSLLGDVEAKLGIASYGPNSSTGKPGVILHSLTPGTRLRPGGLLIHSYTWTGRLWFALGYDSNGFREGVIERFWDELVSGVHEFLLSGERIGTGMTEGVGGTHQASL